MFNRAVCENGKMYVCGKISRKNEKALEIVGTEYAEDHVTVVEYTVQARLEPSVREKAAGLEPGNSVIMSYYPSPANPNIGTTDEILSCNEYTEIKNKNGENKILIIGWIASVKWNMNHRRLAVSFVDLKNSDGLTIGTETEYRGEKKHWLNVNYFPEVSNMSDSYTAERAEKELNGGDLVIMTVNRRVNDKNGSYYVNYNGAKYECLAKKVSHPGTSLPEDVRQQIAAAKDDIGRILNEYKIPKQQLIKILFGEA